MSAQILYGAPVAAAITEKAKARAQSLSARGVIPTLAAVRVGEAADALSYERSITRVCAAAQVELEVRALPYESTSEEIAAQVAQLCRDDSIHGVLLMLPLPDHADEIAVREALEPRKDVDGCTDASLAGVFTGSGTGYPPCAARAVMELLDFYGLSVSGKTAAVIGRSLVIGRPLAMLLTERDATVTLCHTKTPALADVCRRAQLLISAAGRAALLGADCFAPGQVAVDAGMDVTADGLCGDMVFADAAAVCAAVSPVPGGVGAVTGAVLALHTVEAAEKASL